MNCSRIHNRYDPPHPGGIVRRQCVERPACDLWQARTRAGETAVERLATA